MDRPEYPVIWGTVSEILKAEYAVPSESAFTEARRLIKALRKYNLDIVSMNWVYEAPKAMPRRDALSEAREWLMEMEEAGRTPWFPDTESSTSRTKIERL